MAEKYIAVSVLLERIREAKKTISVMEGIYGEVKRPYINKIQIIEFSDLERLIDDLPAADVRPVVRGRWE